MKFNLADLNDDMVSAFNDAEIAEMNRALDQRAIKDGDDSIIRTLATLDPIQYDKGRAEAAREIGVSVGAIDKAVKAAKAAAPDTNTKGQGRSLEIPEIEPWSEPVKGSDLLDDMCEAMRRYLVLPEGSAETIALWIVHTHAYQCFEHTPRLALTSPEKQCGKTTTLDVIKEMVARPMHTSNMTAPLAFRVVEMVHPTFLVDEADRWLSDKDELIGILNDGHRRGGTTLRLVGDDHEPRQFSTWSPMAIAMIGRLPDTLADRSVAVRLRRKRATERVHEFRSDRTDDLRTLARRAARWAQDNQVTLGSSDPAMGQLFNRSADNWRPLIAIADAAGGDWPTRVRSIAHSAETAKQDQSTRAMLLADLRDLQRESYSDRIGSAELATILGAMDNRPWSEWRHGKPITAAALARQLAPFGIQPGTRREGGVTFKGYLWSDFDDAFASYLPDQTVTPSQPNNHGHCDTLQTVTRHTDVTLSKASQPNNHGHCDGVTVQKYIDGHFEQGPAEPDPDAHWFNADDQPSAT